MCCITAIDDVHRQYSTAVWIVIDTKGSLCSPALLISYQRQLSTVVWLSINQLNHAAVDTIDTRVKTDAIATHPGVVQVGSLGP